MEARKIVPLFCLTILLLLALPFVVAGQDGLADSSPDAITAYRWGAMGQFYADQGMLADDPDSVLAARWLAIGRYYEKHDLLRWQEADFEEAAKCQEFRWLAMVQYYTDHGLLTQNPEGA